LSQEKVWTIPIYHPLADWQTIGILASTKVSFEGYQMSHQLFSRRGFAQLIAGTALAGCSPTVQQVPARASLSAAPSTLAELERRAGGKLGVNFLVPSTGATFSHRGGERFGMASSFKLALAAVILKEADQGRLSLATTLPIAQADILGNSPMVEENLSKGVMTIQALAEAAQRTSDNAATNILLRHIGGPAVFTDKLRELGDAITRLDRYEPEMMRVAPGDPRDTTTPDAMSATIGKMLLTDWLSPTSNALLVDWMVATRTGLKRIRAGLPQSWKTGDKTGTGMGEAEGTPDRYNDIAVTWPTSGPPMIISAYYESPVRTATMRDEDMAVLAAVGTIAASWHRSLRL
jgi:beta-lactamase class A